jgi:hypothetical protein
MLCAAVIALLRVAPARAARAPLPPERLKEEATLIVVGTVQSYDTRVESLGNHEQRTHVDLEVLVESVEKGDAGVGATVRVRCWRLTQYVFPENDFGQQDIPAPGSRARFFVRGGSQVKEGAALEPNGIQLLEGATGLQFPARRLSQAVFLLDWPLVLLPIGALLLLALVAATIYRKRKAARPSAP